MRIRMGTGIGTGIGTLRGMEIRIRIRTGLQMDIWILTICIGTQRIISWLFIMILTLNISGV